MMKKTNILLVAAFLVVSAFAAPAFALTGDEILAKVEKAMNAPADRTATIKMIIKAKDGTTKERKMKISQKGAQKKLFTFLSPADVAGVGFLVIDDDTLYLYSPAFGKIRRIASHVKNENFMATDFSYNDLSESKYPEKYSAVLDKTDGEHYVLTCKPKPGAKTDYSKLVMRVNKKTYLPSKVEMFNKAGKLFKVMTNGAVKKIDGYWTPTHIKIKDVLRNHTTTMKLVNVKHDQGLADKVFSKRNLKKVH